VTTGRVLATTRRSPRTPWRAHTTLRCSRTSESCEAAACPALARPRASRTAGFHGWAGTAGFHGWAGTGALVLSLASRCTSASSLRTRAQAGSTDRPRVSLRGVAPRGVAPRGTRGSTAATHSSPHENRPIADANRLRSSATAEQRRRSVYLAPSGCAEPNCAAAAAPAVEGRRI
jgi:hypothetical protein